MNIEDQLLTTTTTTTVPLSQPSMKDKSIDLNTTNEQRLRQKQDNTDDIHIKTIQPMNNDHQTMIILCCSLISMLFGILLNTIINYYQLRKIISIIKSSKQQLLNRSITNNEVNQHTKINDLVKFIPLTPYKVVDIDQTTSHTIVDDLIIYAKETKRFTITCDADFCSNQRIQIEFVQESQSIIALIVIFHQSTLLYDRIKQLFSIIFDSFNIIQTWDNINIDLLNYKDFNFFMYDNLHKVRLFNIQQNFKTWYNGTFRHNENCNQILNFLDIDGPLCSCSHRPYKNPNANWLLSKAITYTFHEQFSNRNNNAYGCLAITKLAKVIQEQWTRQQVKDYIKEHHIDHQNA